MSRTPKPLTPKQQRFVEEYLLDLNGSAAYRRAGYKPKNAENGAYDLLRNPSVKAAIDARRAALTAKLDVTAERIIKELARLAFVDITDAFDADGRLKKLQDIPEDTRRALLGLEVEELFDGSGDMRAHSGHLRKVKFGDKARALELLAKIKGLFIERVEHSGPGGGPVKMDLSGLSNEEFDALGQLLRKAAAGAAGADGVEAGGDSKKR